MLNIRTAACLVFIFTSNAFAAPSGEKSSLRETSFVCIDPQDVNRYLGLISRGLRGAGLDAAVNFQVDMNRQFKCYSSGYSTVPLLSFKSTDIEGVAEITVKPEFRERGFPVRLYTTSSSIQ